MKTLSLAVTVLVVALLVVALAGCGKPAAPSSAPTAQPQAPGAGAAKTGAAPARADAYINVSSGCQQPTVDLLKKLADQYSGRVDVSVTDFGTPEGADKWRAAGLSCMTIQFNGAYAVTYPQGGQDKTVIFQMPPGMLWEPIDLVSAFESLASGTLHGAIQADIDRLTAPVKVSLHARGQSVTEDGAQFGQVIVLDRAIARLYGKQGGLSPADRARAAKKALDKWTSQPISPADLSVAKGPEGWGVYGGETLILQANDGDIKGYGQGGDPQMLARFWLNNLRRAVVLAVNDAREVARAAAQKAPPPEPAPPAPGK
jgi:hypothetical protein